MITESAPSEYASAAVELAGPPIPEGLGDGARRLLSRIGNTPLLDLSHVLGPAARELGSELLAKAEMANPGGSVKDRPARHMMLAARDAGQLDGRRVLDATSGNTGIALAMIGAAMDIGVTLCLPRNASIERRRILGAFGAELVLTDPMEGSDGAIREARRMIEADPEAYCYVDQYSNSANWRAHFETTGPEIWMQTEGRLTHFVAGLGTSGTFCGTARYLAERAPGVRLISMQPDGPFHGLEGMKHMPSALVPAIYDDSIASEETEVSTEDAYAEIKALARGSGLLVGISAAANVVAGRRTAERAAEAGERAVVVTILCDGADKYLSEPFWDED
ncbi:MAG: cysteine synthase family protein [Holophagales bacterium]|nr:cysteine synthase family protein [Holophagales bacterium]MYD23112.1 cysteine synthase family protein [Holophagales bacterium]MYI34323.1 cysteine synthase family protein [Holophagales bacterium]